MRLYLGSVIINRLPFRRQAGEICLRYAEAYRLINYDARDVKMTRTRVLRQILAGHKAEIERHTFGFIDSQLLFDQRRELFANLVKLLELHLTRQFTGHLFVAQRHLFIAHIQQTIGAGVG